MSCSLCQRIELAAQQKYPLVIKEFNHSYLMLGEHQFFAGYCVLISKEHYQEMSDIPSPAREDIFQELMLASTAIQKVMKPDKMNLCSLGNVVPHLHWHLFPRYKTDEKFHEPPWLRMQYFDSVKISGDEASKVISKIRAALQTS
jgi:diadenosine tetraphosphate (Ap4A) HIT family hydrolase